MVDNFETTRWSIVVDTGGEGEAARDALSALCQTYRPPVLAYVRAHTRQGEEAEDLAQAFFVHLLEKNLPARADRERGKFRAFLLTSLKNFLINERQRVNATRRGGNVQHMPGNALEAVADNAPGPDEVFEREWARTILREALARLEHEARHAGKATLFAQLRPYLVESQSDADYAALAQANDMRRNTIAVAVHRLRTRLQGLVREVLTDTTGNDAEADEELHRLRAMLSGDGR